MTERLQQPRRLSEASPDVALRQGLAVPEPTCEQLQQLLVPLHGVDIRTVLSLHARHLLDVAGEPRIGAPQASVDPQVLGEEEQALGEPGVLEARGEDEDGVAIDVPQGLLDVDGVHARDGVRIEVERAELDAPDLVGRRHLVQPEVGLQVGEPVQTRREEDAAAVGDGDGPGRHAHARGQVRRGAHLDVLAHVRLCVELEGAGDVLQRQALALVVPGVLTGAGLPQQERAGHDLGAPGERERLLEEPREPLRRALVQERLDGGERGQAEAGEAAAEVRERSDHSQSGVPILDADRAAGERAGQLSGERAIRLDGAGHRFADPVEGVWMLTRQRRGALREVGGGGPVPASDKEYGAPEGLERLGRQPGTHVAQGASDVGGGLGVLHRALADAGSREDQQLGRLAHGERRDALQPTAPRVSASSVVVLATWHRRQV